MADTLTAYIRNRLKEKGISGRAAAEAMGVSNSYFVRVATGKIKRPGVEFCKKLAELFDDSALKVMRLAGWLPEENEDALTGELRALVSNDPEFMELLAIYRRLATQRERRLFIALVKVATEALEHK